MSFCLPHAYTMSVNVCVCVLELDIRFGLVLLFALFEFHIYILVFRFLHRICIVRCICGPLGSLFFGVCSFVRILLRLLFLLCVSQVTDVGSFFLSLILFIHSSESPTRMNRIIIYERLLFEFSFIFGHFFRKSFDAELMPLLMLLLLIHAIFFICATFYRMRFGCVILP